MKSKRSHLIPRWALLLIIMAPLIIFVPLQKHAVVAAPDAAPSISVNPSSGLAGITVTVSGSGFTGGFNAAIKWDGVEKVTFTMSPNGSFSKQLKIPGNASPGAHTISVCNYCGGGEFEENASTGFKVTPPPPPPPKPTTPPSPKPTTPPPPIIIPPPVFLESVCGDLGLGPDAKVLTFDPFDVRMRSSYLDTLGVNFEDSVEGERPPVEPHSGEIAARSLIGEFGSTMQPIRMSFSLPLQAVGMFVGIDRPEKEITEVSAILTVFGYRDGVGDIVTLGSDSITFPPGPSDIIHCLRFTAGVGDLIARAQLEYIDGEGASAFETRWMDDLTILFAEEGRLPENLPPIVRITSPESDATITSEEIITLHAEIIEDRALWEVRYIINDVVSPSFGFTRSDEDPTLYYFRTNLLTSTNLISGEGNTLSVSAMDTEGQIGRDTIQVKYIPPPQPEQPEIVPGTEPLIRRVLVPSLTQHGPFDISRGRSGFQDFLIAGKDAMLRVQVHIGTIVWDTSVSVDIIELIMTHEDGSVRTYPGLLLDGSSNTFVEGGPFNGSPYIHFYIPGEDLNAGRVQFDLHFLDRDYEEVFHNLGPARFHTIPPQYQFFAKVDRAVTSADYAELARQSAGVARAYAVPNGAAAYSRTVGIADVGLIYTLAPNAIPLPRGFAPGSSTYDPTWDFVHDGPGELVRLIRAKGKVLDCNGDGEANDDDVEVSWLVDGTDADNDFDEGYFLPNGHVLLASAEPEDLNGDGSVSQDEIAFFVRSFKDLDGDGRWYDYANPEDRVRFTPNDPYMTWRDSNHNCLIDSSERGSSMAASRNRTDNISNYIKSQVFQMMVAFVEDSDLDLMPATGLISKDHHIINWVGSCGYQRSCWAEPDDTGVAIAHEIGHGWGLPHSPWLKALGGAVNLPDLRWVPSVDSQDLMYKTINPFNVDFFASGVDFERLFKKGRDGWDYYGLSFSIFHGPGSFPAFMDEGRSSLQSLPRLQSSDQSFALFGSISRDRELSVWNSYILDRPNTVIPSDGEYSLTFFDVEGALLYEIPFEISFTATCDECPEPTLEIFEPTEYSSVPFIVISPYPVETASVEISHLDDTLAFLSVSANAPSVKPIELEFDVLSRNEPIELRWEASDADGDVLAYNLAYSADGGETYLPVISGLSEPVFSWDPALAPGSFKAKLRVTVSDGFHTASAVSETFALEPTEPSIHILRPEAGDVFGSRELTVFEAVTFDLEDGNLGVAWSDEEGNIVGTGARIVLEGFEIGQHTFTASAMDSDGNEVRASISFEVTESPEYQAEPAKPFPGEVFVDQASLSIPECSPHEATFSALVSEPSVTITSMTLLVSPSDEVPLIDVGMEKDESGVFSGTLIVNADDPAGEWQYAVIALDEVGVSYRTEPGTITVNACTEGAPEGVINVQMDQLIPYLQACLIAALGLGLLLVIGVLVVRWSRSR
jgi:hypothetical protein